MSPELEETLKKVHQTCVTETGVDEKLIEETNKGKIPDDRNLKCYMKCIMVEMGIVSSMICKFCFPTSLIALG